MVQFGAEQANTRTIQVSMAAKMPSATEVLTMTPFNRRVVSGAVPTTKCCLQVGLEDTTENSRTPPQRRYNKAPTVARMNIKAHEPLSHKPS